MIPQSQPKKPKNSSKVNLTISAVFHGLIILALVYFAAREGYLGKKIKEITVYKVEKEKPPEKPPEKKAEPPKETPSRSSHRKWWTHRSRRPPRPSKPRR